MRTDRLRINQLSPEGFAWYQDYLRALDASELGAFGGFLAEHVEMCFNGRELVRGREAVLQALGPMWQGYAALEHDLLNIYGTDRAFMLEALNHYRRHDGRLVSVPAVALTDRDHAGKVASFRIYSDVGPVFAG